MNHSSLQAVIQASKLSSCIGKTTILHDLSFKITANTITSILGPSGSGKTTLLNTLAGFQAISSGELYIKGQLTNKVGFTLAPDKRGVGMVFQDHALFPHLTVLENLKTGLNSNRSNPDPIGSLIDRLHLTHLSHRFPHELSGGQQQRTALARALVAEPDIILLDEPFANLNQDLQIEVGIELIDILKAHQATVVMVTHDQNDAMAISDQIIMLNNGHLIQSGSPDELYHQPANRDVAAFLSRGTFINAQYLENNQALTALGMVDISLCENKRLKRDDSIDIWVHPEDVLIDHEQGFDVDIIQHAWRPLDILLKVRTQENKQLLLKTEQNPEILTTKTIPVRLQSKTPYRAFSS